MELRKINISMNAEFLKSIADVLENAGTGGIYFLPELLLSNPAFHFLSYKEQ